MFLRALTLTKRLLVPSWAGCVYTSPVTAVSSSTRQRFWHLTRLSVIELGSLPGIRLARWLCIGVCALSVILMLIRRHAGAGEVVTTALEGVGWLSWLVAGTTTLSASRHWLTFQQPLSELAALRSIPSRWLTTAAPCALAYRIATWVGGPALLLVVLSIAVTHDASLAWRHALLIVLVPIFAGLLAVGLTGVTVLAVGISRGSAVSAVLAVVFVPHVVREVWPHTPSIIMLYDGLWREMVILGGGA